MRKLPDITPKIIVLKLGGHEIDFRQITMSEFNLVIDIQNLFKDKDLTKEKIASGEVTLTPDETKGLLEKMIELLIAVMHVENTYDEKKAFLYSIDLENISELQNLMEELMEFSGMDTKIEGEEDKKKSIVTG